MFIERAKSILEELKKQREAIETQDLQAIIEEKVSAYRAKVTAEAQAERNTKLAFCDVRIETADMILSALAETEETTPDVVEEQTTSEEY